MIYGFLTTLNMTLVAEATDFGRAKYKLLTDLAYMSDSVGLIVAPAGYITDLASVPRLPLAYALFGDTSQRAAVVHDYLCDHYYKTCKWSWVKCADVFLEAMKHEGVSLWRRQSMYWGVKYFGGMKRNCEGAKP